MKPDMLFQGLLILPFIGELPCSVEGLFRFVVSIGSTHGQKENC